MSEELTVAVYKSQNKTEFFILARSKKDAQALLDSMPGVYTDLVFQREITVAEARNLDSNLVDSGIRTIQSNVSKGFMMTNPAETAKRRRAFYKNRSAQ